MFAFFDTVEILTDKLIKKLYHKGKEKFIPILLLLNNTEMYKRNISQDCGYYNFLY